MNELNALVDYVTEHPNEKAPALALVDLYEEQADMTHRAAVRAVAMNRREARREIELTEAAALLADGSCQQRPLTNHIRQSANHVAAVGATVLLVPGRRAPLVCHQYKSNPGAFWYAAVICVGARWVLNANRLILESWAEAMRAQHLADAALFDQ